MSTLTTVTDEVRDIATTMTKTSIILALLGNATIDASILASGLVATMNQVTPEITILMQIILPTPIEAITNMRQIEERTSDTPSHITATAVIFLDLPQPSVPHREYTLIRLSSPLSRLAILCSTSIVLLLLQHLALLLQILPP